MPAGSWGDSVDSDYLTYMLWKAGIVVFLAFCWGLYCGITGRSMRTGQRDIPAEQARRSTKAD